MALAIDQPHLIVGPISYKLVEGGYPERRITNAKWEFIGFTISGSVRRWALVYDVETRKFRSSILTVWDWDTHHAAQLRALYQPIAVLRSMLPKGSIATAMKAMVSPEDLAECTALSMRGGVPTG